MNPKSQRSTLEITIWVFLGILFIVSFICLILTSSTDTFANVKKSEKSSVNNCSILSLSPITTTGPRMKPTHQFIVFQIDCGGLNNIRMQFETLTVLSWLSGRTLVLPPPTTWYLLGNKQIEPGDIFDLDCWGSHIPILTYDEWIEYLGYGSKKSIEYKDFFRNLERGDYGKVTEPLWSPGKTKFKMEFLNQKDATIWYFYCDRIENFRNLDHRMLGNTECYFQILPKEKKKEMRKLLWEAIKYKHKFYESANRLLEDLSLRTGEYNAVHVRNWEGSKPQYKTRTQEEIIDKILGLDKNIPILLLSQDVLKNVPERIKEKMDKLFREYKLVRPPRWEETHSSIQSYEQSVLEMLLAVPALRFLGSPSSTYSIGIMQLRGYFARFCDKIDDKPDFIDGKTSDYLNCSPLNRNSWDFDKISMQKTKDFYKNV